MLHRIAHVVAASLLLVAGTHAAPNQLWQRDGDSSLEPWVTVNDDGKPSTVTPVMSTISGTPTLMSAAPHDITATVFTKTSYAKIITSTGTPLPTATKHGAGAFPICHNLDGDMAPWCLPNAEEPLYVGTTYYFTWDPKFFSAPNTTVHVAGNYINKTTGETMSADSAFLSPLTKAGWGFWTLDVTDKLLKFQGSQNISVSLLTLNNGAAETLQGPRIFVTKRPGPAPSRGHLPQGAALYIALPAVIGLVVVCVAGTCIWNRHHREFHLGRGVMGRNYDVSKIRLGRFGRKKKRSSAIAANERIKLMEREIAAEGGEVYRDFPEPGPNHARRDSEALGSLAGSPTEDRHMDFPPTTIHVLGSSTGNAFRDELTRQRNERS